MPTLRPDSIRVAVVTGGGSGIGAALCRALAAEGYFVVAADIDERAAAAVAAAINDARGGALGVRCDVTKPDEVDQLAGAAWVIGDGVDLWINNAGIAIGGAAQDLRLADWRRVLDINLLGVVHGVHAIYPKMIARGAGQIINVASVAGLAPYPFALPYTTSKHAVVGLSQALRAEARAHGVRVSVACPGMIETPIWERSTVRGALANGRGAIDKVGKMSADACAAAIVRGAAANRGVIPVTAEARVAWWLNRLSPALATRVSSGLARIANSVARR